MDFVTPSTSLCFCVTFFRLGIQLLFLQFENPYFLLHLLYWHLRWSSNLKTDIFVNHADCLDAVVTAKNPSPCSGCPSCGNWCQIIYRKKEQIDCDYVHTWNVSTSSYTSEDILCCRNQHKNRIPELLSKEPPQLWDCMNCINVRQEMHTLEESEHG